MVLLELLTGGCHPPVYGLLLNGLRQTRRRMTRGALAGESGGQAALQVLPEGSPPPPPQTRLCLDDRDGPTNISVLQGGKKKKSQILFSLPVSFGRRREHLRGSELAIFYLNAFVHNYILLICLSKATQ